MSCKCVTNVDFVDKFPPSCKARDNIPIMEEIHIILNKYKFIVKDLIYLKSCCQKEEHAKKILKVLQNGLCQIYNL